MADAKSIPISNILRLFEGESEKLDDQEVHQTMPDRISGLPEALLVKILSSLDDTKDAVKTGVLSKRWKNLWTHVDNLCFDYPIMEDGQGRFQDFVSFVNHTLTKITRPNIKKFKLMGFDKDQQLDDDSACQLLDKWLQWAVEKNVEILNLPPVGAFDYTVHKCCYDGSSFVELEIQHWIFTLSDVPRVSWTSLRRLSLFSVSVDDEGLEKMMSGSPALETLTMIDVLGFRRLNIMSRSMKKLLLWMDHKTDPELKINAPWLKEFDISGNLSGFEFWGEINMPSLLKAEFNVKCRSSSDEDENYYLPVDEMYPLIAGVCHADELILRSLPVQALSMMNLSSRPSPLFKCKHLKLYLPVLRYELPGIVCLLEKSPQLETLVLEVTAAKEWDFYGCVDEMCDFDGEEYLREHLQNLPLLRNLEVAYCRHGRHEVDLLSFNTSCLDFNEFNSWKREFFFELVSCVLRNARVLEKLVIVSAKQSSFFCLTDCISHYIDMLTQRLFGLCLKEKNSDEWEFRKKELNSKFSHSEFIFHNREI